MTDDYDQLKDDYDQLKDDNDQLNDDNDQLKDDNDQLTDIPENVDADYDTNDQYMERDGSHFAGYINQISN